jgi:hypothetical protein
MKHVCMDVCEYILYMCACSWEPDDDIVEMAKTNKKILLVYAQKWNNREKREKKDNDGNFSLNQ